MSLRILGVDPGSIRTGWAVVDLTPPRTVHHVDNGVILAGADDAPLPLRLTRIAAGLGRAAAEYHPQVASVETAYHAKNARSALVLGQARGAAVLACAQAGLEVAEYGPMQVKLAVTGNGRASKVSVQHMVATLLALPETAQEDASDALALALTHAFLSGRPAAIRNALPPGPSRRAKKGSRAAWTDYLTGR